jgi:ABC-type sugar transport system permease subunit
VSAGGIVGLFVRWAKDLSGNKGERDHWIPPAVMLACLALAAWTAPAIGAPVRFTGRAAAVSGFYLYKTFERGDYGYAAAIAFMLMAVALLISALNMRLMRQED